ncbi:hypothetical protein GQ44DRAFT_723497 [Phaeosphaeriaceae sp. PMI808]|nr:hypothetical protein GQ44DRAFT_723497 [Phaeosphaeriaceae sp. PMI808]
MAISNENPGMKVEITVDDQPLPEFDDDQAESKAVTKYVQAISGKKFALKFTFSEPFPTQNGVEAEICVDGEKRRILAYKPDYLYQPSGHFKRGVSFQKGGQWYRQDYQFTALNIGTQDSCLSAMGAIPEKALKGDARSLQATLGEPRKISFRGPRSQYDVVTYEPFASFHFKYRSQAGLSALRVFTDDEGEVEDPRRIEQRPVSDVTPTRARTAQDGTNTPAETSRTIKRENDNARYVKREHGAMDDEKYDDDEPTIVSVRAKKRPRGDPEIIVID